MKTNALVKMWLLLMFVAAILVFANSGNVCAQDEDKAIYKVVVNHEEQYSIWPAEKENALGWKDAGFKGSKAECLAHIKEVWTDMRPLSLRKQMEEAGAKDAGNAAPPTGKPKSPSTPAVPVTVPEKVLDEDAAAALVAEASGWLSDLIDDDDIIAAITDKWNAREDFAGKPRTQILNLLLADAKSAITDKATLDAFVKGWIAKTKTGS